MPEITIYTTPFCGYCHRAKSLLKRKNVPFTEIDVSDDPALRQQMMQRAQWPPHCSASLHRRHPRGRLGRPAGA